MRSLLPGAALFFLACSFSGGGANPPAVDAGEEVVPDAPEAPCEPDEAPTCSDAMTLRQCAADGSAFEDTECPLGCLADPDAHCATFTPSNNVGLGTSAADSTVDQDWLADTDTGEITLADATVIRAAGEGIDLASGIGFTVVDQGAPRDIGVFEFRSLVIEEGRTLRATGTAVLGLAATGAITVNGLIDVSAGTDACGLNNRRCAGPGGGDGGSAGNSGSSPQGNMGRGGAGDDGNGGLNDGESGGGGGAFGTDGGASGDVTGAQPASGGTAWAPPELIPISGGAGAGGGATEPIMIMGCDDNGPYPGGVGGGAGGAVQIASASAVSFAQVAGGAACGIDAGGTGGAPGDCSAGGGGGGAGGGILIEAASVTVDDACMLAANGGGGGSANNEALDGPGQDGQLSTAAATGGGTGASTGGNGAARATGATDSGDDSGQTGGGGGGAGVIFLRTLSGAITSALDPSPAETVMSLTVF